MSSRASHTPHSYHLRSATEHDAAWLERLRRDVYQELFVATFGGWDEARHARQFRECWERGRISLIELEGERVGMIQMYEEPDELEIGELQISPGHQGRGLGTQVLRDQIARAHGQGREVALSTGLKNERAYRLYRRLGFQENARSETHIHLNYPV